MKVNYYRFPENTPIEDKIKEGCPVFLKNGARITSVMRSYDTLLEEKADMIDYAEDVISGITITEAKNLLRKYGGSAITEHIDRDGCLFETTPIQLKGNNSRHKYNVHL